jgi:hypothetical protein
VVVVGNLLVYIGAGMLAEWGIAHAAPIRTVLASVGVTSNDGVRVVALQWLVEAVMFVFVGTLALIVTADGSGATVHLVQRAIAIGLFVIAGLHAALGARTSIMPMRVCPFVVATSALLILCGSLL